MGRGPKAASVVLTAEEREALQRLVRRRSAGQAAVMRARIVLMGDAEPDLPNGVIADRLGVRTRKCAECPARANGGGTHAARIEGRSRSGLSAPGVGWVSAAQT